MGKRIISQRRGNRKGRYRVPSHRYMGKIGYPAPSEEKNRGEVLDIVNSIGHSAPLMFVEYKDGQVCLMPAPLGIKKGQFVYNGTQAPVAAGNILPLKKIPAGTVVCNLEKRPYENGKFMRSSGTSALVVGTSGDKVLVKLSSKKPISFNGNCRATI